MFCVVLVKNIKIIQMKQFEGDKLLFGGLTTS